MKNILCVLPIREDQRPQIEAAALGCSFVYADAREVTDEQIDAADIILGNVKPPERLHEPEIEYMALNSAGADDFVKPGILRRDTVLTNATGVFSKCVAEYGLADTLALQKNLHLYRDNQNKAYWHAERPISSISDSVVLVVGLGDIGCYYAKLVKSLGAYVIGIKRRPSACPDYADELYTTDMLPEVIGRADVVFSVLPGTNATYHLYNAELFAKMKKSAIFVNCGRGASVDIDALCDALEEHRILAAACDVFEVEPLPADHRAWKEKNLLITPHRAGFFDLPGTLELLADLTARNLSAWLTGGELTNVVDFNTGYKK